MPAVTNVHSLPAVNSQRSVSCSRKECNNSTKLYYRGVNRNPDSFVSDNSVNKVGNDSTKLKPIKCPRLGSIDNTMADTTISTKSASSLQASSFLQGPRGFYGQVATRPTCRQVFVTIRGSGSRRVDLASGLGTFAPFGANSLASPKMLSNNTNAEQVPIKVRPNSRDESPDAIMPLSAKGYYRSPFQRPAPDNKIRDATEPIKHVRMKKLPEELQRKNALSNPSLVQSPLPQAEMQKPKSEKSVDKQSEQKKSKFPSEEELKKIRESSRDLAKSYAEKKRIWTGSKGRFSTERLAGWYAGMHGGNEEQEHKCTLR
eukprot:TRINITY_DN121602_c1_g1_i1.p2 TRINITY_DN121602_c1_g1~~TRINITY_DN121602_c1_g1_i1.p2  ORF type:complete len:316 (-),score=4.80 TRINITY_DN121602_c1_g1_i1:67-1014(-)